MRATFWEYGTNGWAVARCGGGNSGPPAGIGSPEDQLNRQVALTADFATAPQLRSPVAFGYLPDGFEVAQISRFSSVSNGVQIKLVRRSAAPPEVISLDFEWPPTIPASPGQVVTINGRQAKIANGNSLTINFEGYGFALDAQLAKLTDPKAELIAITKALRLVDPRDQSTWFPAQVGLP